MRNQVADVLLASDFSLDKYLPIIIGVAVVLLLALFIIPSYVKAPPNKAYIISGLRRTPKVLIGKAGIKLPFFERKDELLNERNALLMKLENELNSAKKEFEKLRAEYGLTKAV